MDRDSDDKVDENAPNDALVLLTTTASNSPRGRWRIRQDQPSEEEK